jgi:hypothetical protein
MLLFAAIFPALTDAGCDPLFPLARADILTDASGAGAGGDPCDDGCVPDCFSCSQMLGASGTVSFEVPHGVMSLAVMPRSRQDGGAPRVPEPVPKPTA